MSESLEKATNELGDAIEQAVALRVMGRQDHPSLDVTVAVSRFASALLSAATAQKGADHDHTLHCCFCGVYNATDPVGYAGERVCRTCGNGGVGESRQCISESSAKQSSEVGDAEVEAACAAHWRAKFPCDTREFPNGWPAGTRDTEWADDRRKWMRAALEAAAAVRSQPPEASDEEVMARYDTWRNGIFPPPNLPDTFAAGYRAARRAKA